VTALWSLLPFGCIGVAIGFAIVLVRIQLKAQDQATRQRRAAAERDSAAARDVSWRG
jgi:hypothetical protein